MSQLGDAPIRYYLKILFLIHFYIGYLSEFQLRSRSSLTFLMQGMLDSKFVSHPKFYEYLSKITLKFYHDHYFEDTYTIHKQYTYYLRCTVQSKNTTVIMRQPRSNREKKY